MNRVCPAAVVFFVLFLAGARAGEPGPDILIADFEGADYGAWTVEGEAFGPGPARGTLPNQMEVSGFEGQGLVNSFFNGDGATGMLTSPPFRLERDYLAFLIGGGMHPGETCINLLVNGEVVRTATGPNDKAGGTERLDWFSWDVSGLRGQTAIIRLWMRTRAAGVISTSTTLFNGAQHRHRGDHAGTAITEDYLSIEFGRNRAGDARPACA